MTQSVKATVKQPHTWGWMALRFSCAFSVIFVDQFEIEIDQQIWLKCWFWPIAEASWCRPEDGWAHLKYIGWAHCRISMQIQKFDFRSALNLRKKHWQKKEFIKLRCQKAQKLTPGIIFIQSERGKRWKFDEVEVRWPTLRRLRNELCPLLQYLCYLFLGPLWMPQAATGE